MFLSFFITEKYKIPHQEIWEWEGKYEAFGFSVNFKSVFF